MPSRWSAPERLSAPPVDAGGAGRTLVAVAPSGGNAQNREIVADFALPSQIRIRRTIVAQTNSSYRKSQSRSADPPYPRRARNIDVAHTRRKKMVAPGNITNGNRRRAQLTRLVSFKGVRS